MDTHPAEDPVETLRRWEATGAVWRVVAAEVDGVTVGLFTCDGAEEMSRFTSDDPHLRAFVGSRVSEGG